MSLKAFHLFFVALAVLLCLVVGVWGFQQYFGGQGLGGLTLGLCCGVLGPALIVYGVNVAKKFRTLG